MSDPICINPSEESLDQLFVDDQGFNCFSICKTSEVDVENKSDDSYFKKTPLQRARYQVFVLFAEKVGII
jgi:hypothetical protein